MTWVNVRVEVGGPLFGVALANGRCCQQVFETPGSNVEAPKSTIASLREAGGLSGCACAEKTLVEFTVWHVEAADGRAFQFKSRKLCALRAEFRSRTARSKLERSTNKPKKKSAPATRPPRGTGL